MLQVAQMRKVFFQGTQKSDERGEKVFVLSLQQVSALGRVVSICSACVDKLIVSVDRALRATVVISFEQAFTNKWLVLNVWRAWGGTWLREDEVGSLKNDIITF